jgi:hypothetical protein
VYHLYPPPYTCVRTAAHGLCMGGGSPGLTVCVSQRVQVQVTPGSWATAPQRDWEAINDAYGRQLTTSQCYRGADGVLTPTRNKPSFTPRRAAEGGAGRECVPHDYGAVRMPGDRAGARSKRHLLQTLIPQPSAVGASSITSSDRSPSRDRSRFPFPVPCHLILSNKFGISESEVLRCLYAVCSPVGLAVASECT